MTKREIAELTRCNVVSSRIRLARNVEGLPFPHRSTERDRKRILQFMRGARRAAEGLFDFNFYLMSELDEVQKMAMIERHLISPSLAENSLTGAVILEKSEGVSVMLNEEDRVREQCVQRGFRLGAAYERIACYDERLAAEVDVAFDKDLGYLTACPTNLGTGMRASTMLFLPALKLAGDIENALTAFIRGYGLTVRGVYGEGSEAKGDMYQLSNTRTLGADEREIIDVIERATVEMCYRERCALDELSRRARTELLDRVARSYAVLRDAYRLSAAELMRLISDAKLGVILGVVPLKGTELLDKLLVLCSAANLELMLGAGEHSDSERDTARARYVRAALGE